MRNLLLAILVLFSMTRAFAQPTPASAFPGVFEKEIYSKALGETRTLYIHIPEKRGFYPVFYLLDAQSLQLYAEVLRYTQNIEKVGPHIIVGIVCSENRNRDMLPQEVPDRPGSGGAPVFLRFLTEELQPYVDKKFRNSGQNILFGGSNAGLFTLYALLEEPEHFVGFISSSTMIGHCNDFMVQLAGEMDPERLQGKYLFMNYGGTGEYDRARDYIPAFHELLIAKFGGSLNSTVQVVKSGGHVPTGSIAAGLDFIYKEESR